MTDGFSGNVALKTAEGVADLFQGGLRTAFSENISTRLGFLLARSGLRRFRHKLDPRRYNGAVFLGLNGISVKSHGGTDALDFRMPLVWPFICFNKALFPEVKSAIHKADIFLIRV